MIFIFLDIKVAIDLLLNNIIRQIYLFNQTKIAQ